MAEVYGNLVIVVILVMEHEGSNFYSIWQILLRIIKFGLKKFSDFLD